MGVWNVVFGVMSWNGLEVALSPESLGTVGLLVFDLGLIQFGFGLAWRCRPAVKSNAQAIGSMETIPPLKVPFLKLTMGNND